MRNSREEAEYLRWEQALLHRVRYLDSNRKRVRPGQGEGDLPPIRPVLEAEEAQQMPDECMLSDLTPVRACSLAHIDRDGQTLVSQSIRQP